MPAKRDYHDYPTLPNRRWDPPFGRRLLLQPAVHTTQGSYRSDTTSSSNFNFFLTSLARNRNAFLAAILNVVFDVGKKLLFMIIILSTVLSLLFKHYLLF